MSASHHHLWTRRRFGAAVVLGLVGLALPRRAAAGKMVVPYDLQANLLAKVVTFDRNMPGRAGGSIEVLILSQPGDDRSVRDANSLRRSIANQGSAGGTPLRPTIHEYESATALARRCREDGISVVYLTSGFDSELRSIAEALSGLSVLSVSGIPSHIYEGVVLSFGLDEGRPELMVHLSRAQAQQVDFKASLLRLATIVDRR